MRSMGDPVDRQELLDRIARLAADTPRKWGTMNTPRMIAHLTDQMRHTLGDVHATQLPGIRRTALVRWLAIYVIWWPKDRIQGPPEAFTTQPENWKSDRTALVTLVQRFAQRFPAGPFGNHAFFGAMTPQDWGVFCYKHFDHHLRQFGV